MGEFRSTGRQLYFLELSHNISIFTFCIVTVCRSSVISRNCRVVRWCWVNFWSRGVPLLWIRVVVANGGCLDIFSLIYHFCVFFSPSIWETARYRRIYCLKGPLSPNQPTNQPVSHRLFSISKARPFVLAVGADGVVWTCFLSSIISLFSPSLRETT